LTTQRFSFGTWLSKQHVQTRHHYYKKAQFVCKVVKVIGQQFQPGLQKRRFLLEAGAQPTKKLQLPLQSCLALICAQIKC